MKEIYLDNAATTKVASPVINKMNQVFENHFGNPSSLHSKGLEAEKVIKQSRRTIAEKLQVKPEEIYFTSGGTEANNWAVLGSIKALNRYGSRIITTPIEHPSTKETIDFLKQEGWEVKYLKVDSSGEINLHHLEKLLTEETILVSIIGVNNELGTIQPLSEIANLTAGVDNLYLHVDGVQALGKVKIYPGQQGIDLYSLSGHKIHGPKGVGALYINSDIRLNNIFYGGNQEDGARPGTENVSGIAGFAEAVDSLEAKGKKLYRLKKYLVSQIKDKIKGVKLNGPTIKEGAPHIASLSFRELKGEVLVHSLEKEGVYVSTGSACHSRQPGPSHVLKAIEIDPEYIEGTLRFSLASGTTKQEIDYAVQKLTDKVVELRKHM